MGSIVRNILRIGTSLSEVRRQELQPSTRKLMRPDHFICFNESNLAYFESEYGGDDHSLSVYCTGLPESDDFVNLSTVAPEKQVLFIDQPFELLGALGWTSALKAEFCQDLVDRCDEMGFTVKVKLHPRGSGCWNSIAASHPRVVEILDDDSLKHVCVSATVVAGYYSTLTVSLHTVGFCFENHPNPIDGRRPSDFLTRAGVAETVFEMDGFVKSLSNVDSLHRKQHPFKRDFRLKWVGPFDGHASERLVRVLSLGMSATMAK